MNEQDKITTGEKIASSIIPFITMGVDKPSNVPEVVDSIAKTIDETYDPLITRSKQFLSCIDFEKLTDYQAKVALLLIKELDGLK